MKKVLVIGGSYFAGRVFIEELMKRKDIEIHVFNRGHRRLGFNGVIEHVGDREDAEQIRSAIPEENWHAVVDFCAYNPAHIEKTLANVPGTIGQYLYVSTTTVCQNSWNLPIDEEALKLEGPQPELGPLASYGYDKWCAENTLRQACSRDGIPYTILRPAVIYGFYNYAPRESYFFDLVRKDQSVVIPEGGLALFSFIWVVDMANLLIRCIGEEKVYNQEFNLSSDELVSYPRIVEVLEEVSGKKLEVVRKSVEAIDREQIPLPFPLDEHLVYSGSKLQRLFDFDYTPFVTGMKQAYDYFQMVQDHREKSASS